MIGAAPQELRIWFRHPPFCRATTAGGLSASKDLPERFSAAALPHSAAATFSSSCRIILAATSDGSPQLCTHPPGRHDKSYSRRRRSLRQSDGLKHKSVDIFAAEEVFCIYLSRSRHFAACPASGFLPLLPAVPPLSLAAKAFAPEQVVPESRSPPTVSKSHRMHRRFSETASN